VARIGKSLWDWTGRSRSSIRSRREPTDVTCTRWGRDRIHPDIPPPQDPSKREHDGWAYGAFLLTHYTKWTRIDASLSFIPLIAEFSLPGATDAESIPDHLIKPRYIAISMS